MAAGCRESDMGDSVQGARGLPRASEAGSNPERRTPMSAAAKKNKKARAPGRGASVAARQSVETARLHEGNGNGQARNGNGQAHDPPGPAAEALRKALAAAEG